MRHKHDSYKVSVAKTSCTWRCFRDRLFTTCLSTLHHNSIICSFVGIFEDQGRAALYLTECQHVESNGELSILTSS